MALAGGIGTALFHRERTGKGSVVDVSLLSAGLWAMGLTILGAGLTGSETLQHQSHEAVQNPLVNTYRTRDGGYIQLVFLQPDRYWPEFCVLVERDDWLADERFVDAAGRRDNADVLIPMLDQLFLEHTFDEWCDILSRQDGQWDVVNTPGHALVDPDGLANGYICHVESDGGATIPIVTAPVQFDEEPATPGRAPEPGADTEDVLGRLGLNSRELARLRGSGVVR
jgi:crotonobetainyl-CoA:carnitine CoA-transferase CaiB-like acyl-CoA transferase